MFREGEDVGEEDSLVLPSSTALSSLCLTTATGRVDPATTTHQEDSGRRLEFQALAVHLLVRCLLPVTPAR